MSLHTLSLISDSNYFSSGSKCIVVGFFTCVYDPVFTVCAGRFVVSTGIEKLYGVNLVICTAPIVFYVSTPPTSSNVTQSPSRNPCRVMFYVTHVAGFDELIESNYP
uniref:Putative adrenomedullin-5-like protein n=1 Tax=Lygus hesperus TaxID=30085 RepID=A0A0A9WAU4_LYGHE